MATVTGSTPGMRYKGFQDNSQVILDPALPEDALFRPLFLTHAQKCYDDLVWVTQANKEQILGEETFNPDSKYYSHGTDYLVSTLAANIDGCWVKTVRGEASERAVFQIYAEMSPGYDIRDWDRDLSTNQFLRDANGDRTGGASVAYGGGRLVRINARQIPYNDLITDPQYSTIGSNNGGNLTGLDEEGTYSMVPNSDIHPLVSIVMQSGEEFNNYAFRLYAVTSDLSADDAYTNDSIIKIGAIPYRFELIYVDPKTGQHHPVQNSTYSSYTDMVMLDGGVGYKSPTGVTLEVEDGVRGYQSSMAAGNPVGPIHEIIAHTGTFDITYFGQEDSQSHLDYDTTGSIVPTAFIDILTARGYDGTPAYTLELTTDSLTFDNNTVHYMTGGEDGDIMNNAGRPSHVNGDGHTQLDLAMIDLINLDWDAPETPYSDLVTYIISHVPDTGFAFDVKEDMPRLTLKAGNLRVPLQTHVDGLPQLTIAEEIARVAALNAKAAMYSESTYYGTDNCRSSVWAMSYRKTDVGGLTRPVSQLQDWLAKMAEFEGSGQGIQRLARNPTSPANRSITNIKPGTLNVPHVPKSVAEGMWKGGASYIIRDADRTTFFRPGIQTTNPNETSKLRDPFQVDVMCNCLVFLKRLYLRYTNRKDFSDDAVFVEDANRWINNQIEGVFSGSNTNVEVVVEITPTDAENTYSWTATAYVDGTRPRTVQHAEIVAI